MLRWMATLPVSFASASAVCMQACRLSKMKMKQDMELTQLAVKSSCLFNMPNVFNMSRVTLFRGMSARFTALVNGTPEPEFEFSFNGVPLFPTDRIHITRERSGLIRLSMAFVEESDIGTYSLRYILCIGQKSAKSPPTQADLDKKRMG